MLVQRRRQWANINPALGQRLVFAVQLQENMRRRLYPANTTRWPDVGLMLGQCLRRWPNIKPALVQRRVFAGYFVTMT